MRGGRNDPDDWLSSSSDANPATCCVQCAIHYGAANMKTNELRLKEGEFNRNIEGRVLPPLILWMLGVPGIIVIGLWFFFFRG